MLKAADIEGDATMFLFRLMGVAADVRVPFLLQCGIRKRAKGSAPRSQSVMFRDFRPLWGAMEPVFGLVSLNRSKPPKPIT